MKINKGKIALIHVAKAKLNMDDDTYRDLLENVCGTRSAKDVETKDFENLMAVFRQIGFQKEVRMTQKQYLKIKALEFKLGWRDNPARLSGFAKRVCADNNWKRFGIKRASKLIQGLQRMLDYGKEEKIEQ